MQKIGAKCKGEEEGLEIEDDFHCIFLSSSILGIPITLGSLSVRTIISFPPKSFSLNLCI